MLNNKKRGKDRVLLSWKLLNMCQLMRSSKWIPYFTYLCRFCFTINLYLNPWVLVLLPSWFSLLSQRGESECDTELLTGMHNTLKSCSYKTVYLWHYSYGKIVLEPHCCDNYTVFSSIQAKLIFDDLILLAAPVVPYSHSALLPLMYL